MQNQTIASVQYVTIEADFAGQRIDNFLVTRLKGVPKTHIYKILRKGEVRVNKKRIQPSYRLQEGDQVRVPPLKLDAPKTHPTPNQNLITTLTDRIIYEDDKVMIINKPSGIAVHGGSGVRLGLVEALRNMFPKLPQLELAHRLDSDTSGCLVLGKKRSALREIHDLFRNGQVSKKYLALTKGHWDESEFRVDAPLQKNQLAGGERIVKVNKEGKASLTEFAPLKSFKDAMLVEATLHTGRTHQIRVHAQYCNHSIAGDEKYGDREFNKQMRQLGLKRLFLHAHSVEFVLPSTGQKIQAKASLDNDLEELLRVLP